MKPDQPALNIAMIKPHSLRYRLLYAAIVYLVSFYASMIPIAIFVGWWQMALIRPGDWLEFTPHLSVICGIWVIFSSRKLLYITAGLITIAVFVLGQALSHWSLFTDNNWRYWFAAAFVDVVQPLLAVLLLARANEIAPRFIRKWDNSYAS